MENRMRLALPVVIVISIICVATAVLANDPPTHAAPAHESGEASHGEHGGEKPALLDWDIGTAVWSIVVFVVLLVILRAAAWKPILTALQNREKFISDSISDAKRDREEAKKTLDDYTRKVEQARNEATAIVEEGRRDAEALRRKLHEDANREVQEMLGRAKRDIQVAQEAAISELYSRTLDLAAGVAGKIVHKQLNATEHRGLLDESIAELAKMNH